jgi:fused signal recognition particle receptor
MTEQLTSAFVKAPLDQAKLDELEEMLIEADLGPHSAARITARFGEGRFGRAIGEDEIKQALADAIGDELSAREGTFDALSGPKPYVVLFIGVNGSGKTTTLGKIAAELRGRGARVLVAAGDTFRAAAVAQLQAWGDRNGVTVIAQGQNADAASVAFDALQAGKARGTEVLIADTAGRLHTQTGLMNELGKIRRVLGKLDPAAPHEVLMVIDGTTGQNALSQLRQFNAAVKVTGLVVTKLDGTAKGGVVFALAREFGIPIRFAGIGERPEDLRVFDPEAFVDALLPEALGA